MVVKKRHRLFTATPSDKKRIFKSTASFDTTESHETASEKGLVASALVTNVFKSLVAYVVEQNILL